jgi:putative membrane protein
VKQYGAMLVKDHGEHKSKAEQVASQLGVEPPTGSSLMQKATYAKLKLLSGTVVRQIVCEIHGQGPR